MRARTLLALLPVAVATAFSSIPAAEAVPPFHSQTCSEAAASEQVANTYTVLGTVPDMEYAFLDVVQRADALEICFRIQFRTNAYDWQGRYIRFAGVSGSVVEADADVAQCTNVVINSSPGGVPVRIATLGSGIDRSICISIAGQHLRLRVNPGGLGALPTIATDTGGTYPRVAAFPAGGSESSLCGPARSGSTYVLTQDSRSFLRRDEPTNSICFRSESPAGNVGGRVDTFAAAGYMLVGLSAAPCDTTVFTTGMLPPLLVTISTSANGQYVCAKVNGTEAAINTTGVTPAVPTVHLDA